MEQIFPEQNGKFDCLSEGVVEMNMQDVDLRLRDVAKLNPKKIAIEDSKTALSWAEFDARLNSIANALIAGSVVPNDKVAILARNSVDYAVLLFGILRAGGCAVPLSSLAAPETLITMVNDSAAKYLFVSRDYADAILPFQQDLKTLMPGGIMFLDKGDDEYISVADFAHNVSSEAPLVELNEKHGFNLIYSSGTTGKPKGIVHNRRFRAIEGGVVSAAFGMGSDSRALVSTPLYSNTTLGVFLPLMAAGGTAVLMEKFDAQRFLKLSQEKKITHAMLVPVQYTRLLAEPNFGEFDLSSYEHKFSTSAPLHQSVKQAILTQWPAGGLTEIYGMTEGGVACVLVAHEYPNKLDTVGQPSPICDLKIIGDDGKEVPVGQPGELVGWSPLMMDGYHNREEATQEASWYDEDGRRYHRSGDIGWMDNDGFIHLLDRKKDLIISGGFNIFAIDLEKALLSHADVADAAVVGAPSAEWGETPVAFVVLEYGACIDAEALRTETNAKLGKAQRLSEIRFMNELPRSPIGKILKRELRDKLAS